MAEAQLFATNITKSSYRGYACPQEQINWPFLEETVIEHSRGIVRRFVRRFGEQLEKAGNGLIELFQKFLEQEADFETVWDTPFGEAREACITKGEAPPHLLRQAASLGLRLSEAGIEGEWNIRMDNPARLRWGRWLLPVAEQLAVRVEGYRARIELGSEGRVRQVRLWRSKEGWIAEGAEPLNRLGNGIILRHAESLDTAEFDEIRGITASKLEDSAIANYEAAFTILKDYAPIYLPWVTRVLHQLIPIHTERGVLMSSNSVFRPGMVYTSFECQPVALAELLVHEATHQYFHLIRALGPVEDGSDKKLYYSPIQKRERPVHGILKAYHALGNMGLFYRMCRESGLANRDYCLANERDIYAQLVELDKALTQTSALTELGMAIWQPLKERMLQ